MKNMKIFLALALTGAILLPLASCVVFVRKDNGRHKGWHKNPNNPHHPTTKNPGNNKGGQKHK